MFPCVENSYRECSTYHRKPLHLNNKLDGWVIFWWNVSTSQVGYNDCVFELMYYFLGIEGQTVPQIRVPPCVCRNLLRILLANLYSSQLTTSHTTHDDMRIPVGWHAACKSLGLWLYESPAGCIDAINTPWVRWSALGLEKFRWWKEKIVTPRCINCVAFCLWEGNDGMTSQYGQPLPSRVRGPLRNTIYGFILARFGPIQWLEWENWVVVNTEISDN